MKEIYRERSTVGGGNLTIAYSVLALILFSFLYDGYRLYESGHFTLVTMGLNIVWLGMWVWMVRFKYEYILREREFECVTYFWGLERHYVVDLTQTESFSQKYEHKFFRKTRIGEYIHRYSMVDPQPRRILTFHKGKGLAAVLFCASDRMVRELKQLMPDKYLGF